MCSLNRAGNAHRVSRDRFSPSPQGNTHPDRAHPQQCHRGWLRCCCDEAIRALADKQIAIRRLQVQVHGSRTRKSGSDGEGQTQDVGREDGGGAGVAINRRAIRQHEFKIGIRGEIAGDEAGRTSRGEAGAVGVLHDVGDRAGARLDSGGAGLQIERDRAEKGWQRTFEIRRGDREIDSAAHLRGASQGEVTAGRLIEGDRVCRGI